MIRGILSLVLNAVALLFVAQIFDGFTIESFWTAVIASLILAILNAIVKPILKLLTLPINIMTLGLFTFVIYVFTLMMSLSILIDFLIYVFCISILVYTILF